LELKEARRMAVREFRIEVPKDVWPYGPATVLLENDIRALLEEIPGLRYGMIEGLYPCVYWDTPLARFAVIPQFFKMGIRHFPPTAKLTYYGPKPMTIVIFDVVLGKHVVRVFSFPCLVPALGKYITVPMEAVVQVRERIYIKPELVEFKTEFYSGVHSIYDLVRDLLKGEAEKLAEENIIASFDIPRFSIMEEWEQIIYRIKITRKEMEKIKEVITNHITNTTLIPRERVESILLHGWGYVHDMLPSETFSFFLQDEPTAIPAYREILSNEDAFLQKYLVAQFIHHNIGMYREYLSMMDLCEGGMNKPYEETIKGYITAHVAEHLIKNLNFYRIAHENFRKMVEPYYPDLTRPTEPWILSYIMRPDHPFRRKVEGYAELTMREMLESVFRVEDKARIYTISVEFRKRYMSKLDRNLIELYMHPKIYPYEVEAAFAGLLADMLASFFRYEAGEFFVPRVLFDLYDKPKHVLSDLYVSRNDVLALALYDALQEFIDTYPYNAWEAVRSRFGVRGVEVKPQRLHSRR
jgi:hypothetical protein